jgi:hypothetical protein
VTTTANLTARWPPHRDGDATLATVTMPAIGRFDDGSTLVVLEDGALSSDGGIAELAARFVRAVVDAPLEAGVRLLWGDADGPDIAIRRTTGARLELAGNGLASTFDIGRLRKLVDAALEVRLGGEAFWLFRQPPIACVASPGDRVFLEQVEPRLLAFDTAMAASALGEATESARRQLLLAELETGGLLDELLLGEKLYQLRAWSLPALASSAAAALELWAYYRSPERRSIVGTPPPDRLIGGPLSLDFARTVHNEPDGFSRFAWWATVEHTFLSFSGLVPARGRLLLSQGSIHAELRYRLEDGTHLALYEACQTVTR